MKDYTYGQVKAYRALINCVEEKPSEDCIGLWGCSPLDLPSLDSVQALMQRLGKKCIPFGMDDSLENYTKIAACKENIVLSPSGLTIAKELGLNFHFDYCLGKWQVKKEKDFDPAPADPCQCIAGSHWNGRCCFILSNGSRIYASQRSFLRRRDGFDWYGKRKCL